MRAAALMASWVRRLRNGPGLLHGSGTSGRGIQQLRCERDELERRLREVNEALKAESGAPHQQEGPLVGVTIVEAQQAITGPLAAMLLADMGATVIKIEPPHGQGDVNRPSGVPRDGQGDAGVYFHNFNRGKRCIALDLTTAEGISVLKELVKGADVFMQNARPGAAERNGFGYEALKAANADLIYCSISGFGQTGPYARRPAYDAVLQTQTGFPVMQGGDGDPVMLNNFICDKITGYQMALAVLAALRAKAAGKCGGQLIEVSMLDAALSFFWPDAMGNTGAAYVGDSGVLWNDEIGKPKRGRAHGQRILPTRDGHAAMMIWPFAPHLQKVLAAFQITEPQYQDNVSKTGLRAVLKAWPELLELL